MPAGGKLRPRPVEPQPEANRTEPEAAQADAVTSNATQMPQDTPPAQETVQDPMAQAALAYVGGDPDAETYWDAAINNQVSRPREPRT